MGSRRLVAADEAEAFPSNIELTSVSEADITELVSESVVFEGNLENMSFLMTFAQADVSP